MAFHNLFSFWYDLYSDLSNFFSNAICFCLCILSPLPFPIVGVSLFLFLYLSIKLALDVKRKGGFVKM